MNIWKELLCSAYREAARSPDPSTQNGALVVARNDDHYTIMGSGYNRPPEGIAHTHERLHTPLKYFCVAHAEFNAVFSALRAYPFEQVTGKTLVCPWAACTNCAKTMITANIARLVRHKQALALSSTKSQWIEEIAIADVMMREVGIEIIEYDGIVGAAPILRSGKYWNP